MRFRRASSIGSRPFRLTMPTMPHMIVSPVPGGSRPESTEYKRGRHRPWQQPGESAQASNRHGIEAFELETAALDERYEAADCHLIQPSVYVEGTRHSIPLEVDTARIEPVTHGRQHLVRMVEVPETI